MLIGLVFSVAAAVFNSGAGLLQSTGAGRAAHSPRPLALQPYYLGGLLVDGLGWVCTVVALRSLPVFAVQAILATAIAMTALAVHLLYGVRLRTVDRFAVAACVVGLGVVAAAAGPDQPKGLTVATQLVLVVGMLGLGVLTIALWNTRFVWALALIGGLGFGGTALAVRALHIQADTALTQMGIALATQLPTYLLVGYWVVGLTAYSRSLQLGGLASMTAVLSVTEVIVPGMVGIVLLGDSVRAGWWIPLGVGLVVAVAGVVVLADSPAAAAAHQPRRRVE